MFRLTPTQDSRTSYDDETGAVRSVFGAELVEPSGKTDATAKRDVRRLFAGQQGPIPTGGHRPPTS